MVFIFQNKDWHFFSWTDLKFYFSIYSWYTDFTDLPGLVFVKKTHPQSSCFYSHMSKTGNGKTYSQ